MFIDFLALSPTCYMRPMCRWVCRWEEFSCVILESSRIFCTFMHIFVLYCS